MWNEGETRSLIYIRNCDEKFQRAGYYDVSRCLVWVTHFSFPLQYRMGTAQVPRFSMVTAVQHRYRGKARVPIRELELVSCSCCGVTWACAHKESSNKESSYVLWKLIDNLGRVELSYSGEILSFIIVWHWNCRQLSDTRLKVSK